MKKATRRCKGNHYFVRKVDEKGNETVKCRDCTATNIIDMRQAVKDIKQAKRRRLAGI